MRLRRSEHGFTLIETIIVAAIVVVVAGSLGAFFLAGASPAVASAGRDVSAAFDEARRTAIAFDAATVVFAPAQNGTGYSARVYQRFPGDPAFRPRSGPAYESTVTINETAAPLGAPGFALTVDNHGAVTGFANFAAHATTFAGHPCPASGAFTLRLAYERDVRIITIPCRLLLTSATPVAFETPPLAVSPLPAPSQTCPSTETCSLALVTPPSGGATCPPGYIPDASPGVCDLVTPPPPPPLPPPSATTPAGPATCPPGYSGIAPNCVFPLPSPTPTQKCRPGIPDGMGFSSCIEYNPVTPIGPAITHSGCGTHTPVNDPGGRFIVDVDFYQDGSFWGGYEVNLTTRKAPWLNVQGFPRSRTCGLLYTLAFSISGIIPESGNAHSTPSADTGDPALSGAGVETITVAPLGAAWGSNN